MYFSSVHNTTIKKPYWIGFFVLLVAILFIVYVCTPVRVVEEQQVTIPQGYSIIQSGELLKEQGLLRSSKVFRVLAQTKNISIKAGTYSFQGSLTIKEVLNRLSQGDYGDVHVSVTLPEGSTIQQMADILERADLANFSKEEFLTATEDKEGYLFPDTYLLLPEVNTQGVIDTLEKTFQEKTHNLDIVNRTFKDIVIMASIIEKEAGGSLEEKKMVAGILWKRLDRGMLLQVDAPFVYTLGKGSAELRISDLQKDNPYNTYTRTGLTPTAIGNPGYDALLAASQPTESLYFFYLHDTNGGIHYGKTYQEHLENRRKYIR